MGHDVRYIGSLKFFKPITEEQENLIKKYKSDIDYFYCLEFNKDKTALQFKDGCEKCYPCYPNKVFTVLEKFIEDFKKLDNDFIEKESYLFSCSEYGLDYECILFLYHKNKFNQYSINEIKKFFIENICQE